MGRIHHREPGVAGTALAEDRLTCDLICDGHHVDPAIVRLAARALGERLVLITDRVDLPEGAHASALGAVAPGADGAPWRRADGTIAGSQLGLDAALRNARRFAGIDLRRGRGGVHAAPRAAARRGARARHAAPRRARRPRAARRERKQRRDLGRGRARVAQ